MPTSQQDMFRVGEPAQEAIRTIITHSPVLINPDTVTSIPENTFTCPECGEFERSLPDSEFVITDSNGDCERWCSDCAGDAYICNECSSYVSDEQCREYYENNVCPHCYDNLVENEEPDESWDEDNDDIIYNYTYKAIPRKEYWPGYTEENKRYFGCELEVEVLPKYGFKDSAINVKNILEEPDFYLKHDGSLTRGFEIVGIPMSFKEVQKKWKPLFDDLPLGLRSARATTCGLHVHVSRESISALTLGKMLVFANDVNNAEFMKLIARRGTNNYCQRKEKTLKSGKVIESHDRYELINLTEHTAEFRMFRGTLTEHVFNRSIEFCEALICFCEDSSMAQQRHTDFTKWLKDQSREKYPNLKKFIFGSKNKEKK